MPADLVHLEDQELVETTEIAVPPVTPEHKGSQELEALRDSPDLL